MSILSILIEGRIEFRFDKNSAEFKQALEDYQACYGSESDADDMLKHVAFYITRFGIERMVEGVGYVSYNGNPAQQPDSGITVVNTDYDDFTFDID